MVLPQQGPVPSKRWDCSAWTYRNCLSGVPATYDLVIFDWTPGCFRALQYYYLLSRFMCRRRVQHSLNNKYTAFEWKFPNPWISFFRLNKKKKKPWFQTERWNIPIIINYLTIDPMYFYHYWGAADDPINLSKI